MKLEATVISQTSERSETYQCALTHEVDGIKFRHWLEEGDGFAKSGAGASDAESHGCSIADVRIVRFSQQRHDRRALLRCSAKEEKQ